MLPRQPRRRERRQGPRRMPKSRPTGYCVDAWNFLPAKVVWITDPTSEARQPVQRGSFVPECRKLLAIRHQLGAFMQVRAIDTEDLVVGAGNQIIAGIVVRLVAFPDPDPLQPDQRGLVVLHRHFNAAAFAVDAAAKSNFAAAVLGDDVTAEAAGIEIAGAVAIFETETERIIDGLVFRRVLGRHQQLHRADLLLRMLRQMAGVITTHEAGIGLLAERAAEHPGIEGGGFGFVDGFLGVTGMRSGDGGNRGGDAGEFHGSLGLNVRHLTLVAVGAGNVQRAGREMNACSSWPYLAWAGRPNVTKGAVIARSDRSGPRIFQLCRSG